jgi:alkanesulfonate monooxygenase SsuD/methylene tetrahydromethanopterin reductase-like flavin-dependent oxidoreductase (luciferase family)
VAPGTIPPPHALRSPFSLGLALPTFPQGGGRDWQGIGEWARRAEMAGAAALWACDHLFWSGPALECLTTLAVASARTSHCAIGSGVLQLPLRRTSAVAKTAASLQLVSGGRLVLGVGIGSHEEEYRSAGAAFSSRGRALDKGIAELRQLWSEGEGRYTQRPVPPPIPIWIGGSSEAARRRAARAGDGWMPLFIPPHRLAEHFAWLDEEAAELGRGPVAHALLVFVSIGQRDRAMAQGTRWMASLYHLEAHRFARHLVAGQVHECAQALREMASAGARHLVLFPATDEPLAPFGELVAEMTSDREIALVPEEVVEP